MFLITNQYQDIQVHINICLLSFSFLTLLKFNYFDKLSHIKNTKRRQKYFHSPYGLYLWFKDYHIYGLKFCFDARDNSIKFSTQFLTVQT